MERFKKIGFVVFFASLFLIGIFFYQQSRFNDNRLHVIFCDVGQGDGILIRSPHGQDILIDGGPDDSILSCLSNHMPFWDRTIELMILSHPHADHLDGLISVLKRYTVLSFVTEKLVNKTVDFKELQNIIVDKKITNRYLFAGDVFKTSDGLKIDVLGPTKAFIHFTSPVGTIGESGEFSSLVSLLSYKNFKILFTGDSQKEELKQAVSLGNLLNLSVLQAPHHGSKTGLDIGIVGRVQPHLIVISVGRKNKYGHPSKEVLEMLKGIRVLRTDQKGEIEIVSDGEVWEVMARK